MYRTLPVAEETSLLSQRKGYTRGNGPPPLSHLSAERKEKKGNKWRKRTGQSFLAVTAKQPEGGC